MPTHLHLIAAGPNLHAIMRDFKRFTSQTIHERLMEDGRGTILKWLDWAAQSARKMRGEFSFWQEGFGPEAIFTRPVFDQKLRYLHENPMRKGLVAQPTNWWYISAGWYAGAPEVCFKMDVMEI